MNIHTYMDIRVLLSYNNINLQHIQKHGKTYNMVVSPTCFLWAVGVSNYGFGSNLESDRILN